MGGLATSVRREGRCGLVPFPLPDPWGVQPLFLGAPIPPMGASERRRGEGSVGPNQGPRSFFGLRKESPYFTYLEQGCMRSHLICLKG